MTKTASTRTGAAKRRFAIPPLQKPAAPRPEVASVDEHDPVDQASYDSFPASDPPAHSSAHAEPGGKRRG